jgi:hypothetical protein
LQAGEHDLALPLLEEAAHAAMNAHAPGRAAELARVALAELETLSAPEQQRLQGAQSSLLEVRGDALLALAQHHEAREQYSAALALAATDRPIVRARLYRKLGVSCSTLHEYAEAQQWLELASQALGSPNAAVSGSYEEYIEIQIRRVQQLYFARNVGPHTADLIRELKPIVEQYGAPAQRCFFGVGAACELAARMRYAWNPEAIELAHLAAQAGEGSGSLDQLTLAQLTVGFLLMAGAHADCVDALDWLTRSERNARTLGDNTLLCRVLAYQAIVRLRLREERALRATLSELGDCAQTAQLPPYVALSHACEAWLVWRVDGSMRAEELATRALAIWDAHPRVFPFQWPAAFTLLEVRVTQENTPELPGLLERLQRPDQQELPEQLTQQLQHALQLRAAERRTFLDACAAVVVCARRLRYC